MKVALSIAGSDPTGGAGLQLDLQVLHALGVHGAGVVTALTVQDGEKVHQVLPVFPSVVLDQLRVLLEDITPHAVKIGALVSDDVVRNVMLGLASLPPAPAPQVPIVLDPVLRSTSGAILLERRAWATLGDLIGRVDLVTPNLAEAADLTGCDTSTDEGTQAAAGALVSDFGAQAALVKGGHREGAPNDLLAVRDGGSVGFTWLEGERIGGGPVRGTGCALSSAIAAHLARGRPMLEAIERGRRFVADGLRAAEVRGKRARFLSF